MRLCACGRILNSNRARWPAHHHSIRNLSGRRLVVVVLNAGDTRLFVLVVLVSLCHHKVFCDFPCDTKNVAIRGNLLKIDAVEAGSWSGGGDLKEMKGNTFELELL
ncbi:hypothetical protein AVEN_113332-1 [Araneus ventricosus]|uniref:Uncharacterized protein n=1 Tax=Araneus ventricosus TaxID=182803 RepID=A0A4Y2HAJ1_ARAVE|nr:hypothetical protein AVEN_113332-1 [Araneus ventricosus]